MDVLVQDWVQIGVFIFPQFLPFTIRYATLSCFTDGQLGGSFTVLPMDSEELLL
jgi:hypothetical protein